MSAARSGGEQKEKGEVALLTKEKGKKKGGKRRGAPAPREKEKFCTITGVSVRTLWKRKTVFP